MNEFRKKEKKEEILQGLISNSNGIFSCFKVPKMGKINAAWTTSGFARKNDNSCRKKLFTQ